MSHQLGEGYGRRGWDSDSGRRPSGPYAGAFFAAREAQIGAFACEDIRSQGRPSHSVTTVRHYFCLSLSLFHTHTLFLSYTRKPICTQLGALGTVMQTS